MFGRYALSGSIDVQVLNGLFIIESIFGIPLFMEFFLATHFDTSAGPLNRKS